MKKILPIFLIFLFACGTTITFTISQHVDEQTVKGLNIPNCDQVEQILPKALLKPLTINIKNSKEYKDKAPKQITSVKMTKLVLKITNTAKSDANDVDNFNFLKSIKVYAEPVTGDSDKKVLIGELDPVPENATTITIPGSGNNIIDFLNGEEFKVTTDVDGRVPCDDVSFDGTIYFEITGKL